MINEDPWIWYALVAAIFVLGTLWIVLRWRKYGPGHFIRTGTEIARVEERADFTFGGWLAVLLLVLTNLAFVIQFAAPSNPLQPNIVVLIWIGNNVLWGFCTVIGRRRTYRVMQIEPSAEPRVAAPLS